MRRMRTGLLYAVAVTLALVSGNDLAAQIGPTLTGESGLFELRNADSLPAGRFSFALYYNHVAQNAAPSLIDTPGLDNPLRYSQAKIGLTVAFGLLSNAELVLSTGQARYRADDRDWNGVINGHERSGRINHNEWDKVRFGFKWVLNPRTELVKVAAFGGVHIPTQKRNDPAALSSYRADWDIGLSGTYKFFTAGVSYTQRSDYRTPNATIGTPDPGAEVPEELLIGIGFNIPIIPDTLHGIFEINRLYYDRSEASPDDFSEALLGARFWFGRSGLSAGAALRVNMDRWVHYGSSPSNIGGLVQIAWSPWVADATVAKVAVVEPAPEPAPAPAPAVVAEPQPAPLVPPAPAPLTEPAPPPRAPTSRTDEVLFDSGKARLTNIAKAILDDVALRLKNNLSATCTIVGHTDPKERGGDHMQLARARADAAKDYLVKRHGIDASRIRTEARGDAEAGGDATRNRRAVVTVTFP